MIDQDSRKAVPECSFDLVQTHGSESSEPTAPTHTGRQA